MDNKSVYLKEMEIWEKIINLSIEAYRADIIGIQSGIRRDLEELELTKQMLEILEIKLREGLTERDNYLKSQN